MNADRKTPNTKDQAPRSDPMARELRILATSLSNLMGYGDWVRTLQRCADELESKPAKRKTWRCFHCDEVFRTDHEAAEHFGTRCTHVPLCTISRKVWEENQWALSPYREEDTDLHRQIANLRTEHTTALRRAEEEGYAKGLRDGRQTGGSPDV